MKSIAFKHTTLKNQLHLTSSKHQISKGILLFRYNFVPHSTIETCPLDPISADDQSFRRIKPNPSKRGRTTTSTRGSFATQSLNSFIASAILKRPSCPLQGFFSPLSTTKPRERTIPSAPYPIQNKGAQAVKVMRQQGKQDLNNKTGYKTQQKEQKSSQQTE